MIATKSRAASRTKRKRRARVLSDTFATAHARGDICLPLSATKPNKTESQVLDSFQVPFEFSSSDTLVGAPHDVSSALQRDFKDSPRLKNPDSQIVASNSSPHVPDTTALPAVSITTNASNTPVSARQLFRERIKIIRALGHGSYGVVNLVQDTVTDQFYALKTVRKDHVYRDAVFAEQSVLKRVSGNPHFLSLRASYEDDDNYYFLTEYYPGGDLGRKIGKEGPIRESQARIYAAQLILGLESLHKLRIIHRDIKPENILIDRHGRLVIADFGLCCAFGRSPNGRHTHLEPEARSGSTEDVATHPCGTAHFMAPEMYEVCDERGYSYPVDVWAFGLVLYAMMHAAMPFGMNEEDDMQSIADKLFYESLRVDDTRLSEAAVDFLRMVLKKNADERPSWTEMKEHRWFADFDWNSVSRRSSPTAQHTMDAETTDDQPVSGGQPEGDSPTTPPSPFDWISPQFASPISESSSSPSEPSPSPASVNLDKWLPPSDASASSAPSPPSPPRPPRLPSLFAGPGSCTGYKVHKAAPRADVSSSCIVYHAPRAAPSAEFCTEARNEGLEPPVLDRTARHADTASHAHSDERHHVVDAETESVCESSDSEGDDTNMARSSGFNDFDDTSLRSSLSSSGRPARAPKAHAGVPHPLYIDSAAAMRLRKKASAGHRHCLSIEDNERESSTSTPGLTSSSGSDSTPICEPSLRTLSSKGPDIGAAAVRGGATSQAQSVAEHVSVKRGKDRELKLKTWWARRHGVKAADGVGG